MMQSVLLSFKLYDGAKRYRFQLPLNEIVISLFDMISKCVERGIDEFYMIGNNGLGNNELDVVVNKDNLEQNAKQWTNMTNEIKIRVRTINMVSYLQQEYMEQLTNEQLTNEQISNESFSNESTMTIDERGRKTWKNLQGQLHRKDGPAIERANGTKFWYYKNQLHRMDGPAVECANGDKAWWFNDQRHRKDGPAIEWANGDKFWYVKGQRHRKDGPAIEWVNGYKAWYVEGKLHRNPKEGPAIKYSNGEQEWWFEGKRLKIRTFKNVCEIVKGKNTTNVFYFE